LTIAVQRLLAWLNKTECESIEINAWNQNIHPLDRLHTVGNKLVAYNKLDFIHIICFCSYKELPLLSLLSSSDYIFTWK